jgi:NTE family protein
MKIGLALGGGGARGLAHLGVLKVLKRENIKIDYICGVSMGAFMGSYYALGLDLEALEKEVVKTTKRKAVKELLDLNGFKVSILKGKKTDKYIRKYLNNYKFSDTKIPLNIVATDLANGDEILLKKGDISEAVLASLSVPGIFPPVKIDDRYLIDGGVVNCTPVDVVEKMGADFIIGVDLVMKRNIKLDKPGLVTTLMQSYEIIRTHGIKHKIDSVLKDKIIIKPKLNGTIDSFKFYDIDKFIKAGEDEAEKMLPEIRKYMKKNK